MKRILKYLLVVLVILSFILPLLFNKVIFKSIVPKEQNTFGVNFIEVLNKGNIIEVESYLDAETKKTVLKEDLNQIIEFVKNNDIKDYELIGYNIVNENRITRSVLTYQTRLNSSWALITLSLIKNGDLEKVVSINIQPIRESLSKINAFTLKGKAVSNYIFLGICIMIALFNLFTVILCYKSIIKKKWLWVIVVLTGICSFTMNWTTGGWGFTPISFNIPSVTVFRSGMYAPWELSFVIPVGSILFLLKRNSLVTSYEESNKVEPNEELAEEENAELNSEV